MSLEPGTRLGPYEVLAKLGEGGMGEVYRAKDTKLNRDVALKILPEVFTTDADRLARFKREAQVLASLNHPNIAAIYGFEDSAATHALVMELVDGEDLSALIARGPVPVSDALPIARQIVDALEAAHEAGIIHRDLKPANIKVRADGTVKVLDFGLAKALDPGTSGPQDLANSPTLTARATQMGMIIGTAAYMAPEQAKGRPVDRRADIWAFGVVLYEMLTGRRAFDPSSRSGSKGSPKPSPGAAPPGSPGAFPVDEGASIVEVLASVLHHDVEWSALPADLPAPIRRLLRRCLEKDPRRRLGAIGDARLELDEDDDEPASVTASAEPPGRQRALGIALAIVAGLWVMTLIPLARSYLATPDAPLPTSFALTPFLGEAIRLNVNQPELAISHDGRRLAYSYGDAGSTLVLRNFVGFGDTALPNLGDRPRSPFFSPDDEWIGYYSATRAGDGGRLMKVPAAGGQPFEVAPLQGLLRGASWSGDGTIVFATSDNTTGLKRVPAAGGSVEELTTPAGAEGEVGHRWPVVMPDGAHVVFAITRRMPDGLGATSTDLAVLDLATRQWRVLLPGGSFPKFVAPGYLVYVTEQGMFAAPFDPAACELRGQAVRVVGEVSIKLTSGAASFDVSDNGTLVYIAGASRNKQILAWVDRGVETPIPGQPHSYVSVAVSPTETRAAVLINDDGNPAVWVQDLSRGALMLVSAPGELATSPEWSRDEKFLYYRGPRGIYRVSADGIDTPQLIFESTLNLAPVEVQSDGRSMLVTTRGEGERGVLQVLSLDGTPELTPLVAESGRNILGGTVSPDGRWLAYVSGFGGAQDLFIRSYPDVNDTRVQVSTGNATRPVWSRDGSTLFFRQLDGGFWSVAVAPDGSLAQAVQILPPDAAQNLGRDTYVTPSGRIINIQPAEDTGGTNELRVVLNWVEALKQQLADGR